MFLTIFCLLFAACAGTTSKIPETIRVTGEGKIRAKPDLVILTLQVSFTQPKMVNAVRLTQHTLDSVLTILSGYRTNENDIKTSSISADKHYQHNGRMNVFTGFRAEQSVDFVLHDIRKFTELTGKLRRQKSTAFPKFSLITQRPTAFSVKPIFWHMTMPSNPPKSWATGPV
ncbi:SIMPL domain-containing protein [Pedobacter sp. P351]